MKKRVGLVTGARFKASELLPYVTAQILGAIVAAAVLYLIASGNARVRTSPGRT